VLASVIVVRLVLSVKVAKLPVPAGESVELIALLETPAGDPVGTLTQMT
jgi:hypothetical protein